MSISWQNCIDSSAVPSALLSSGIHLTGTASAGGVEVRVYGRVLSYSSSANTYTFYLYFFARSSSTSNVSSKRYTLSGAYRGYTLSTTTKTTALNKNSGNVTYLGYISKTGLSTSFTASSTTCTWRVAPNSGTAVSGTVNISWDSSGTISFSNTTDTSTTCKLSGIMPGSDHGFTIGYSSEKKLASASSYDSPFNTNYSSFTGTTLTSFENSITGLTRNSSYNIRIRGFLGNYIPTYTQNGTSKGGTFSTSSSEMVYCSKFVWTSSVTTGKATDTVTLTLASSSDYTGSDKNLISSFSTASKTGYVGLGSSSTSAPTSWSTSLSAINAGTYYVWYKTNGNNDYNAIPATYKGSVTITTVALGSIGTPSNAAYTGSAQTPTPAVTATVNGSSKTLTKDTDYTLSYSNNTNAGTATVTATGKGNYSGTKSATWIINPAALGTVIASNKTATFNYNTQYLNAVTCATSGCTIKYGSSSGTYSYTSPSANTALGRKDAGTKTIYYQVSKTNYTTKTGSYTLTINPLNLNDINVLEMQYALEGRPYTYTGNPVCPDIFELWDWDNEEVLVIDEDYTTSFSNNINAGENTATVTATGKGNFTGTYSETFTINRAKTAVEPTKTDRTYNGSEQNGYSNAGTYVTLTGTTSTTFSCALNNLANFSFTATPDSNHAWSDGTYAAKTYTWVMNPKSIAVTWGATTSWTYDGNSHAPTASVDTGIPGETIGLSVSGAQALPNPEDTPYYIATASIESTSIGTYSKNYILTNITKSFTINKANSYWTIEPTLISDFTYAGTERNLLSAWQSCNGYGYAGISSSATIEPTSWGTAKATNAGDYHVWVKIDATTNYNASGPQYVGKVTISKKSVTVTWSNLVTTYNGQPQVPSATVAGAVSGETISVAVKLGSVQGGQTTQTNAGSYSISALPSVSGGQAKSANYDFGNQLLNQTFVINKADSSFSLNKLYDTKYTLSEVNLSSYTANPIGNLTYEIKTNGTTTASTLSNYTLELGAMNASSDNDQEVVVTITDPGNNNYSGKSIDLTITVQKYTASFNFDNTTSYVNQGSTLSIKATAISAGGTVGSITYAKSNDSNSNATLSGTTLTGDKYSSGNKLTITATLAATTTVKGATITREIEVKDSTAPTPTISGGNLAKRTSQTVTLSASDNDNGSGVDKYYWGTSSTGTPNTVLTAPVSQPITQAGTYYLRVSDKSGNIGTTSIIINSYTINNLLETASGTTNTYTSANYVSASNNTYLIQKNSSVGLASVYTNPHTTYCEFKGCSTTYTTSAATLSTSNITISNNGTTYYMWFNRDNLSVPTGTGTSLTYNGSSQGPTFVDPVCSHSGSTHYSTSGTRTATNADSYTATWSLSSTSYQKWSDKTTSAKSINWSIAPKSLPIPSSPAAKTYDGTSQSHGITVPSGSTIAASGSTTSAIDKGTYNVIIALNSTTNYKWSDNTTTNKTVSWTINPKSVAVTWGTTTSFTYNGSEQAPTASASSGVTGETVNLSVTSESEIGSYTAVVTIASVTGGRAKASNYSLYGDTQTYTIVGKPRLGTVAYNKIYLGTTQVSAVYYHGIRII